MVIPLATCHPDHSNSRNTRQLQRMNKTISYQIAIFFSRYCIPHFLLLLLTFALQCPLVKFDQLHQILILFENELHINFLILFQNSSTEQISTDAQKNNKTIQQLPIIFLKIICTRIRTFHDMILIQSNNKKKFFKRLCFSISKQIILYHKTCSQSYNPSESRT